ncbi:glutaminase A [Micropruina sonneratiae]|uniref:glutaminase A n=1 Tax=Micropruina sonneratiae TaxID=2986940 RepID=UPI002227CAF8|nr:glutaminase A [Micropruina sp. KQZ13P-5]MCW3158219.1 glutaminase A [Micropruina sp. KQZ13P-5]
MPVFEAHIEDVEQRALTGTLPAQQDVIRLMTQAYQRYRTLDEGVVADYIPILGRADPARFGLSLVGVNGFVHELGDTAVGFSIQSISKAFVFALVREALGHEKLHEVVGVNNTGLPFNSVIAIELNDGSPMNSMNNAGAIATTALIPGADAQQRWDDLVGGLSAFAGHPLEVDQEVYRSEAETNHRNQALGRLLQSYGRLAVDPAEVVDLYTRQCVLTVTSTDPATMGATLADGGVNPVTGERVVSAETCRDTLAVLASCGMYERSGEWLFEIGLPGKSGVSGGIVAVSPGKGALGSFSPPLDPAGNSVRGQRACAHLSRALGLNLFASARFDSTEGALA